jgi:hypothetical protein
LTAPPARCGSCFWRHVEQAALLEVDGEMVTIVPACCNEFEYGHRWMGADAMLQNYLYEAADVLLTRVAKWLVPQSLAGTPFVFLVGIRAVVRAILSGAKDSRKKAAPRQNGGARSSSPIGSAAGRSPDPR